MVAVWKGNLNIATSDACTTFPSAVVIGSAPSRKLVNLDRSGQKWRVAPLSTMAPSLPLGTEESLDAISAKSDVQVKAKASGFSALAMFANSSFLADASFADPPFFTDF